MAETITNEADGTKGKFVLSDGDEKYGELIYTWPEPGKFIIEHTEVGSAYGGKGYGKKLVIHAVNFAREKKAQVIVHCSYAKSVIDRNKDLQDVLQ